MLGQSDPHRNLSLQTVIVVVYALSATIATVAKVMTSSFSEWGAPDWATFGCVAIAALTGIALVLFEIDRSLFAPARARLRRAGELSNAIDFHFLVPPIAQRPISYVQQDERDHLLYELVLPPKDTTPIEIRLGPNTRFHSTSLLLGCMEGDRTARKPEPNKLFDPYGQAFLPPNPVPGVTPGHVKNSRREYRWNFDMNWNHIVLVLGVELQTFDYGRFKLFVTLNTDEGEITKYLSVLVSDADQTMRCVNQDHERHPVYRTRETGGAADLTGQSVRSGS